MATQMRRPGGYFSIFESKSEKNLHFNKFPSDSNIHSSLRVTLLELLFPPNLLSIEVTWESLLKVWIPSQSHGDFSSVALEWAVWEGSFNKCLCGPKDQASLGN